MNVMEEDFDELVTIGKMMEEDFKVWEEPHGKQPKRLKPRASIPMTFEVIAFTTPKVQEEEEIDEIEDDLYEEVEIVDEDMGGELEEPTMGKMEVDK